MLKLVGTRGVTPARLTPLTKVIVQRLQLVMQPARYLRGAHVVDQGGITAALGHDGLCRVVGIINVEVWHLMQGHVGQTGGRESTGLAGQKFQRAMCANMHDGIGPKTVL